MAESNVAVLIDFENTGLDAIQYLLDQLSDVGRVIVKRAYADWSLQRGKRDQLLELGIEAIHHFISSKSGKNSSDICLAIDAVDLLYEAPVDTFVIVSSDSDFVPLVSKLRAAGKTIIGAGRRGITSATLVKSCDRFIYLDDSKPAMIQRQPRPRAGAMPRGSDTESLVARAMEASMDDMGQVVGSRLYQTMQRIDPSFSFKALGHRTFSQFLASCKVVKVSRPQDASDLIVQLNQTREPAPGVSAPAVTNGAAQPMTAPPPNWDQEIDAAWSKRQRKSFSGRVAASDAARVLDVPKLGASKYPSLDKLLAASELLTARWHREGNAIIRNQDPVGA